MESRHQPVRYWSAGRREFIGNLQREDGKMVSSQTVPEPAAKILVTLKIKRANAHVVSVEGTFNNGRLYDIALEALENDMWQTELFLAPGDYQYHFVIDGHWINDPTATQFVANDVGELNSVLRVR